MSEPGIRDIYFFDMHTKEFLRADQASVSESGGIMVPANATLTPPPSMEDMPPNTTYIWDVKGNEWQLTHDYRNVPVYNIKTKERLSLKLGEFPDPAVTTLVEPADPRMEWDESIRNWRFPLDVLKEIKNAELKQAYLEAENGPCNTGVKGTTVKKGEIEETEEIEIVIRSNLTSRDHIQLLLETPAVKKEGSEKADDLVVLRDFDNRYIQITREQLAEVLKAQKAAAIGYLHKKWMLQERINDAQTREEVEATTWDSDWSDVDSKGE